MALQNKKRQWFKSPIRWLRHIIVTASTLCCACTNSQALNALGASTTETNNKTTDNFQLSQSNPEADVNFTINFSPSEKPINMIVNLDAAALPSGGIKLAPEYYLTATVSCADAGEAIKSTTFAPYPMGAEGKFILALPQASACFKASLKTAILHVKLKLQVANSGTPISLTGNISAE
ncbi:MAG: hypothetical protein EOO68_07205 [Moraxellaceae bacterium]|nr:MAG: hypothetical protein EOO68_07205 [Moraxellaceae bacterium]